MGRGGEAGWVPHAEQRVRAARTHPIDHSVDVVVPAVRETHHDAHIDVNEERTLPRREITRHDVDALGENGAEARCKLAPDALVVRGLPAAPLAAQARAWAGAGVVIARVLDEEAVDGLVRLFGRAEERRFPPAERRGMTQRHGQQASRPWLGANAAA